MGLFRLLHASDFHIAQFPYWAGTPTNPWLAPLTRLWRQQSHDPFVQEAFAEWVWSNGGFATADGTYFDAILLTGDMATTGEVVDLQEAYRFVDDAPLFGGYLTPTQKPTLGFAKGQIDLSLLPGNHDRYRSGYSLYLPGGTTFDTVFCPGPNQGSQYWCAKQGFSFRGGTKAGNAAVLTWTIDFSLHDKDQGKLHYGLPGWLGQGRVLREILYGPNGTAAAPDPGSLVDDTQSWRQHAIDRDLAPVVIWAMHFDPFSTDGLLQFLDSDLLVEATSKAGVSAILCGHTHESKIKALSSKTAVFACGSTTAAAEAHNDFQVLEIDVPDDGPQDPTFRATWYRYDSPPLGTGTFLKVRTVTV
jgi:3',5'-cyclic AMP phosphodiesterase CpdA